LKPPNIIRFGSTAFETYGKKVKAVKLASLASKPPMSVIWVRLIVPTPFVVNVARGPFGAN